ncbi:MAG: nuclear transport factor 2 family protein [Actinomycetota bacterium]
MVTPAAVRATVDAYVATNNANNRAGVLALFAPDAEFYDPVGTPPHIGRTAIGAFYDQARSLARSFELVPRDIVVCGTEAAMVFEIHVTIDDATGLVIDVVEIFELDDAGLIRRLRAYWDMSRARTRG